MPERNYKNAIDEIHTDAVRHIIHALNPNPILGAPPPMVDKSETTLPCALARPLLDKIHSNAVFSAINDLGPNHLLGRRPPPIHQQVALAQLPSGYCTMG